MNIILSLLSNRNTWIVAVVLAAISYVGFLNWKLDRVSNQNSQLVKTVETQKGYIEEVERYRQRLQDDIREQTAIQQEMRLQMERMNAEYSSLERGLYSFKSRFDSLPQMPNDTTTERSSELIGQFRLEINQRITNSFSCIEAATGNSQAGCNDVR